MASGYTWYLKLSFIISNYSITIQRNKYIQVVLQISKPLRESRAAAEGRKIFAEINRDRGDTVCRSGGGGVGFGGDRGAPNGANNYVLEVEATLPAWAASSARAAGTGTGRFRRCARRRFVPITHKIGSTIVCGVRQQYHNTPKLNVVGGNSTPLQRYAFSLVHTLAATSLQSIAAVRFSSLPASRL